MSTLRALMPRSRAFRADTLQVAIARVEYGETIRWLREQSHFRQPASRRSLLASRQYHLAGEAFRSAARGADAAARSRDAHSLRAVAEGAEELAVALRNAASTEFGHPAWDDMVRMDAMAARLLSQARTVARTAPPAPAPSPAVAAVRNAAARRLEAVRARMFANGEDIDGPTALGIIGRGTVVAGGISAAIAASR